MNVYKFNDKWVISVLNADELKMSEGIKVVESNLQALMHTDETIYMLVSSSLSDPMMTVMTENMSMVQPVLGFEKYLSSDILLDDWLLDKVKDRKVIILNTCHPRWENVLRDEKREKMRVHLVGLGDVGSNVAIGLRLIGGKAISELGIYARRDEVVKRWEMELNQIADPSNHDYPKVKIVKEEEMFNCDVFVFCASKGVPPVGQEKVDVRMVQFENNDKIVRHYAAMAREQGYEGMFFVVSDPVDLLCMSAYEELNSHGNKFPGDHVVGFGLGVMNARAMYYSEKLDIDYLPYGRAFGPHGKELVVANNPVTYHHEDSLVLTEAVVTANLQVRELGYKPFIGPAYSSGAISIVKCIQGDWHYSANFLEGCYFGSMNRRNEGALEVEHVAMHHELVDRLRITIEGLKEQWSKLMS